ncbi:hypothetical protein [Stenotrophomonas nematodicola]|uniref:Fibronectin type-III domain-containing protein n=1 Tax=Stenotrophomonas nematodicola TaxID=2656746 RepID=A0ABW7D299_9GAMM
MQARKITLIEIGAGPLPAVTPAPPWRASWFPTIYVSPETPPVDGVTPEPVADGVLIEWEAVNQAGVIYVIERGPTQAGPWTEIHRTTETRYLYSDGSGQTWYFRITATVRGKPGQGTVVEGTPLPTAAQLIEQQQKLDKEIADRFEADAAEAAARADGLAQAGLDLAFEAQARAEGVQQAMDAVAAEAQSRAEDMLNERLARTAAITELAEIQQGDHESLARALSEVAAGSGTQFDSKRIWYFDQDVEGWTGNGAPGFAAGWLRPANAPEFPYVQSPDALEIDGGAYSYLKLRVRKVGTPAWAGLVQWILADDRNWNAGKTLQVAEPTWDSNGTATVTAGDIPWAGQIEAIRVQAGEAQTVSDYYLIDWVALGRPTPGAGVALVQEEVAARVAADSAEASQRETLAVQLRGDYDGSDVAGVATGLIASERDARVTADEATAQAMQLIEVRLPLGDGVLASEASVLELEQAMVDADSALAEATQLISARLPDGDGKVASVEALDDVTAKVEQTADGLAAMGERVTSLNAQFDGQNAGDEDWNAGESDWNAGTVTVYTVIADGDHAQARKVDAVTAEFGEFKGGVTEQIEAIADDVSAQALQLVAVHAELEDKASAAAVNQLRTRVEENEDGITSVAEQLGSVKAEVDGKASAQVVQGMQAQVQQNADGLTQVLAKAFLHLIADGGNGPLIGGMEIDNNGQVVNTRFLSDTFQVIAPGADRGMEWRDGYLRVWNGSAQRIIGTDFGNGMEGLMDYFGPNVGAGAATKANAVMWMDNGGNAYWGGALAAGVLRNAVQTTTTVMTGTQLVCGPFSTNGRNKNVVLSFSRTVRRTKTASGSQGFVAGGGENTCTINIYRKVENDAETFWTQLVARGGVGINNEIDGPDTATSRWGGAVTLNDGADGSRQRQYRAEIVGASEQEVTHQSGSFNGQTIEQSLSIVSVET